MPRKQKSSTFKTRAPFGIAMKRFEGIGFHPNLDSTGSMKKNKLKLGPGQYNPQEHECAYKKRGCSSWKRKVDVEEFSKNLGYRNAPILKERTFRKSIGGPGFYDISEEIFKRQTASCMHNVGFGRQKRFWNPIKYNNPPPGTYSNTTLTYRKQFSKLPSFEWDGFIDRFKEASPPYRKPPNLYNPEDGGSINALLSKVVSKRGPYDCFTGPRDGTTIKNHFAPPSFQGPLNCFNIWPTELEVLLNHPAKQRYGLFLKAAKFSRPSLRHMLDDLTLCYRDPDEPSPCHYNVESIREFKQNKYPFNKSVKEARPPIKWKIHPGVGRYNPKYSTCNKAKQASWVFKSVTGRTEYKAVEYNAF